MADIKKEAPATNYWQESQIFLLVLILLAALLSRFFYASQVGNYASWWDTLVAWLIHLWESFKLIAVIIMGICAWWITYSKMKLHNLREEEEKIYGAEPENIAAPEEKGNAKWVKVIEHLNSVNPSDWRLAIIEADIMLDELLTVQGYHGDSVGDKLKAVEPSDMLTLQIAWEAHLVRNRIAHSGSDFELNEREAKRVISLFEQVFKEFQII